MGTSVSPCMRVLVPVCLVGSWLSTQPQPCHLPTKTAGLSRLIYGIFLSLGRV
jgi:hypothetical protein